MGPSRGEVLREGRSSAARPTDSPGLRWATATATAGLLPAVGLTPRLGVRPTLRRRYCQNRLSNDRPEMVQWNGWFALLCTTGWERIRIEDCMSTGLMSQKEHVGD